MDSGCDQLSSVPFFVSVEVGFSSTIADGSDVSVLFDRINMMDRIRARVFIM